MRKLLLGTTILGLGFGAAEAQTLNILMESVPDTRFVEERFSMEAASELTDKEAEIAAILATLVAHKQTELSAQIVRKNERDASNWKWVGRWERMHR